MQRERRPDGARDEVIRGVGDYGSRTEGSRNREQRGGASRQKVHEKLGTRGSWQREQKVQVRGTWRRKEEGDLRFAKEGSVTHETEGAEGSR